MIKSFTPVFVLLSFISLQVTSARAGDISLSEQPANLLLEQEADPFTPTPTDEGTMEGEISPTETPVDTLPENSSTATPEETTVETPTETPAETPIPNPEETASEFPAEISPTPTPQDSEQGCPEINPFSNIFRVDGVRVNICTRFDAGQILQPSSDDFVQYASSIPVMNQATISLQAIPYGVQPATEAFPTAERGIGVLYLDRLIEMRRSQGATFLNDIPLDFFGKEAWNLVSLIPGKALNQRGVASVLIAEWIAEAGGRVWLLRAATDFSTYPSYSQLNDFIEGYLSGMVLISENLDNPSRSVDLLANVSAKSLIPLASAAGDLPLPAWWSGMCNVNNHAGSFPLGSSYQGVIACGPLNSEKRVNFGAGVPQLEWQCPELVKRFMYLKYGIPPYSANGKDVVRNYGGTRLVKVANGTKGIAPRPGDILSYGDHTTYGHTSLVSASSVDASGNGWVTIIEQNYNASGTRTHEVSNWTVIDSMIASGWLTDPLANIVPVTIRPSGKTFEVLPSFEWNAVEGASAYRLQVYKDATRIYNVDISPSACADGLCTFSIDASLAYGKYSWRVRSFSAGKWNPFSAYMIFSIAQPIPKMLLPVGVLFTPMPAFEWSVITGADQYEVQILDSSGRIFKQLAVVTAACGNTCQLQPGITMPYDSYRWRVRAFFKGEWQAFSVGQKFQVANPVPTPRTPAGTVYTANPRFVWSRVPKATLYRLQIYDGDIKLSTLEISNAACDSVQCRTRSKLVLDGSNYTWRVRAYAAGEWRAYSAYTPFSYAGPTPKLLAPIGQTSSLTPTYEWSYVQGAMRYRLQVVRGTTNVIDRYVDSDACIDGICQFTPQIALQLREYKWRVHAYAGGVWRPYSAYRYFTVSQ